MKSLCPSIVYWWEKLIFCKFEFIAADRQMQMRNEENLEKRNQLIIESQSMTRDVKNWWNSTLNDNDY